MLPIPPVKKLHRYSKHFLYDIKATGGKPSVALHMYA